MPMKVADSVMMLGVFDGVLMAPTHYQTALSYAGTAHKPRLSFAFMSPDPVPLSSSPERRGRNIVADQGFASPPHLPVPHVVGIGSWVP
jgi:hypothetical protein